MKCEYCNKEISKKESYVTEHWTDIYNRPHRRILHDANGQNFMDSCYNRFSQAIPINTAVEIEFPVFEYHIKLRHVSTDKNKVIV